MSQRLPMMVMISLVSHTLGSWSWRIQTSDLLSNTPVPFESISRRASTTTVVGGLGDVKNT